MEGGLWCVLVMLWVWAWATEAIIAATDRDGGAISECAAQTYGHRHGHTYARTHTHNYTESTITEEIALNKTLSSQEQIVLIAAVIPTAYPKYRLGDKVKLSKQRDL
mmetsp:Transcript_10690/g.28496  ORF Transcript_10690/g.28496 Transcript_10690/m.28496 type:complete len:107 (+) Transcript_10690:266-586(+)